MKSKPASDLLSVFRKLVGATGRRVGHWRVAGRGLLMAGLLMTFFGLGCGKSTSTAKLPADLASRFDAQRAWRDLERVVSFGPRPSGSEALAHTAKYVMDQLRAASLEAEQQVFTTNT
ncbi:MAG: hypothetical protein N2689_03785, partial [Verrucomicrobiae bacterium]|nr:hypothetical protein [Verrucomicrobiae bacterium]